jgi:hypothetical protein
VYCPSEVTTKPPESITSANSISFLISTAHLLWRKCVFVATAAGEANRANAAVGLWAATVEVSKRDQGESIGAYIAAQ